MAAKIAQTSIIVFGSWNPAIITPAWLFHYKVVDNVPENSQPYFDQNTGSMAFKIGDKLVISSDFGKLVVTATDGSDCGSIVARILGLLPHTPVRGAVATSFLITCRAEEIPPSSKLPSAYPFTDVVAMQESFVRPIQGGVLQVALTRQGENDAVVSVNVQRNVDNAPKAAEFASAWSTERAIAVQAVRETFNIEINEPD
jgi:hypothetical protein